MKTAEGSLEVDCRALACRPLLVSWVCIVEKGGFEAAPRRFGAGHDKILSGFTESMIIKRLKRYGGDVESV